MRCAIFNSILLLKLFQNLNFFAAKSIFFSKFCLSNFSGIFENFAILTVYFFTLTSRNFVQVPRNFRSEFLRVFVVQTFFCFKIFVKENSSRNWHFFQIYNSRSLIPRQNFLHSAQRVGISVGGDYYNKSL